MTNEELNEYFLTHTKEEVIAAYEAAYAAKETKLENDPNLSDKERFNQWIDFLDKMKDGETDAEQFAYEISGAALRMWVDEVVETRSESIKLEEVKERLKKDFIKYDKDLLKAYGWKKTSDVPWEKYLM